MSFPYEDLSGFTNRTTMPLGDVRWLEDNSPGFIAQQIASWTSWVNGRLRKRYGNNPKLGSALPFGRVPPALVVAGTNPPSLQLMGTPILGSLMIALTTTTAGPLGTAVFKYTINGGVTWTTGVAWPSSGIVPLAGTGLSVQAPSNAVFTADNQYAAATPVPEIVLVWLNHLVTLAAYRRRGFNPNDPSGELIVKAAEDAKKEVLEAADSKDGLFDLPVSEDLDSAVTTGGPLGRSDVSPYAWQTRQAVKGRGQDNCWFNQGPYSGIWGQ